MDDHTQAQTAVDGDLALAAHRFGTPVFVYDLGGVTGRYRDVAAGLPPEVVVHFAMKANGSLAVAAQLAALGAAVDVCSLGELRTAQAAGFADGQILFTGPGKSNAELAASAGPVVVESELEAARVSELAAGAGPRVVLLRVNPDLDPHGADLPIAQRVSKFGIDEDEIEDAYVAVAGMPGIDLAGLHMNVHSGVLDPEVLLAGYRHLIRIADRLEAGGHPVRIVDFGGGIGVPYRPEERPFAFEEYAAALADLIEEAPERRYFLEIGRYLTAEFGWLVTSVIDVKMSKGRRVVIVDAGINTLFRPHMRHANRLVSALNDGGGRHTPAIVAGPLLSPEDVLTESALLPALAPGEQLVIPKCGAYAFGHSIQPFSQHGTAAEVVLIDGDLRLARRRTGADEILRDQVEPGSIGIGAADVTSGSTV